MVTPILDFPPVERKYVAVHRFKKTITPRLFYRLLESLELSEMEFVLEFGEQLIGNPALFNKEVAEFVRSDVWRVRH